MNKKLYRSLVILLAIFVIASCRKGELSSEFLRIAKIKSLNFNKTSRTDDARILPIIQRSGYNYRLGDWKNQWSVAKDNDYLIYRGGAAKSDTNQMFFVILWSNSQGRAVFSELGPSRIGSYPSGLTSSP
jgi:hypothetical protein